MNRSPTHEIAEINAEIIRLTARRQALQEAVAAPWPKRLTLYARCSEDSLWEKGQQLGLEGDRLSLFAHFSEVALEVEVAEDGVVTVLTCNGKPMQLEREEKTRA